MSGYDHFEGCTTPQIGDDPREQEEPEIIGYACLGCGHTQDDGGECECCTGNTLEPIYE